VVDGGIAVTSKGRVACAVAGRRLACGRVRVVDAVEAHVPLLAGVRTRSDQVVPHQVDKRFRAGVGRLIGSSWRGIIDREPLPVGAWAAAITAEEVLLVRRT